MKFLNLSILFFLWKAKPQQLPSDCGTILSNLYADMRDDIRRKLKILKSDFSSEMTKLETFEIRFGRAEFGCGIGFKPHIAIGFGPLEEKILGTLN